MSTRLPLAITMGEPAGVGGELVLKAWRQRRADSRPFFVIDSPERLSALSRSLDLAVPVMPISEPAEADAAFPDALPVLPIALAAPVRAGHPDATNAPATIAAIELAAHLSRDGRIAGIDRKSTRLNSSH